MNNCTGCHPVRAGSTDPLEFNQTYHAHKVEMHLSGYRGANPALSHYSQACFKCHTVGYDRTPSVLNGTGNGGAFAVISSNNWSFPTTFSPAIYAAVPDVVKATFNVQCESCHGPAGNHNGNKQKIGKNFAVETCGACHSSQPAEWYRSQGHKAVVSEANGTKPSTIAGCSGCHNGPGFVAMVESFPATGIVTFTSASASNRPTGTTPITCATCHDPHKTRNSVVDGNGALIPAMATVPKSDERDKQLRFFDRDLQLINGTVVTGTGHAATCMACHRSRRSALSTADLPTTTQTVFKRLGAHYGVQTDMFFGTNGAEDGTSYGSSAHTTAVMDKCTQCHMVEPPNKRPGDVNEMGGHTWRMHKDDDTPNATVACGGCHTGSDNNPLATFDRRSTGDWDGNGKVEGIQTEVTGLMTLLDTALTQRAATQMVHVAQGTATMTGPVNVWTNYKSTENAEGLTPTQMKAAWNWAFVKDDKSEGVHNAKYTIQLLQRSYKMLTGSYPPGSTPR
ncbi:MAG: hypothetical protein HY303_03215 [Candidatus Wallbacteria bacterium]|nr:hypothetical protein [Candidatus Wallbacteria bacterium]